jgi:hypothetical protein
LLKLPDGTIKVLVEGLVRARVDGVREEDGALSGNADVVDSAETREPREVEAIARSLMSMFEGRDRRSCRSRSASAAASSADGEEPARVLPQRADEGDPEGAGRAGRRRRTNRGDRAQDRIRRHAEGGPAKAKAELKKLKHDVADVGRSDGGAQLPRLAARRAVEEAQQGRKDLKAEKCSTPITTAWRRSRNASSSTSRCSSGGQAEGPDPVPRRPARRRQDLARPARSPRPPAASSCAWRSAACATRPRSAATAAPTSARCRARSSRTEEGRHEEPAVPARRDRQDVDGLPRRSVVGAARGARPEQNTRSTTTTSRSTTTCRSDVRRHRQHAEHPGPLLDRMEIIRCPATPRTRRSTSRSATCCPSRSRQRRQGGEIGTTTRSRHRALLHARGRRAQPRARDRQDLPQGGQGALKGPQAKSSKPQDTGQSRTSKVPRQVSACALRLRRGRGEERGRPGHRPGVDRSRRRSAADRGHAGAGQGQADLTGKLGDVMQESASRRRCRWCAARAERSASTRLPPEARHPRARARRRDAEGRPERRHRDGDRAGVGADRHPGARRRGDDRRDHPARRVLPIGGLKEKLLAAHAAASRTGAHPGRERQGSGRDPAPS